ncbi:hypothetical protein CWE21_10610 [Pseudidiomarina aquimaris]|uniref:Uncharacterized protein n=1 Tax=Pseudidiomarina aquimaris TaxID=641841 RepID=A0A432XCW7_9GAMM|nr:hypothetical protein [Pseudidiomarina aquimaris]RUO46599.1 hypothetical protein CWE21_10610 [Pseudidiomarina aquimaris]
MMIYGIAKESRERVHVTEAVNGGDFICALCRTKVIVVRRNNEPHHFRHHSGTRQAGGGGKTRLHEDAIDKIKELGELKLPNGEIIRFDKVDTGARLGRDVVPDAIGYVNERAYAIEIYVTHRVDEEKIAKLEQHNVDTVEVDLSHWYRACPSFSSPIGLEELLVKYAPRRWIVRRRRFPRLQRWWTRVTNRVLRNTRAKTGNYRAPKQLHLGI